MLINFCDVSKEYQSNEVIKHLSFAINRNEVVALVGTNGAGKTTTIKLLLGIIQPTSGKIERWIENYKHKIGVQFQTTPFFEEYNVEENFKLFSTFNGVHNTDLEVSKILSKYNLKDCRETLASKLSLGQQKRLALSLTTLHNPELIILDEPSAGLDPSGQKSIQDMILALKKEGKSVLFSSHDMLEVKNTADKIVLMDRGKLMVSGKPYDLLKEYKVKNLEELFYKLTNKENEDEHNN